MIPQNLVDARYNRLNDTAQALSSLVTQEINHVVADVSAHLSTLKTTKGAARRSPKNSSRILETEDVFKTSLDNSQFYPLILSNVSSFVDQIEEFATFYSHMPAALPVLSLSDADHDHLSDQAAAAVAVLESHQHLIMSNLRQFLAKSLNETDTQALIRGAITIVTRMNEVTNISLDQCNTWFRSLCSLAYARVAESGRLLKFSYAGPTTRNHRDFCASMLAHAPCTREEIDALDNGQGFSAFHACGGYQCTHFWEIVEVS